MTRWLLVALAHATLGCHFTAGQDCSAQHLTPALSLLQTSAVAKSHRQQHVLADRGENGISESSANGKQKAGGSDEVLDAQDIDRNFYLYEPDDYEPRFHGSLAACKRKGADYMFVERLLGSKRRVFDHARADVVVVPCLFETYRRCTTNNHAEKPPGQASTLWSKVRGRRKHSHPEDFEEVPWKKPFDAGSKRCLDKVMQSDVYRGSNGANHLWVAADWSMNFGRTIEQELLKNMTIGRIEVVDDVAGRATNRAPAVNQSRCSVVVPYASDVGYVEDFSQAPTFEQWAARRHLINFRFEDRKYVLFCKARPCKGAKDATRLRRRALDLAAVLGEDAQVAMKRVPLQVYAQELHDAKFCLVVQGDTPSSHSFYDALAANCIPILISNRWPNVAQPMARGKHGHLEGGSPYMDMAVVVNEQEWMNDIPGVIARIRAIAEDEHLARSYFEGLQRGRRAFLWSMPGNTAARRVLSAAAECMASPTPPPKPLVVTWASSLINLLSRALF